MKGIDFETFAEAPCGRWMHRCNSRFLFYMRMYRESILRPREIKIFLHSHWTPKAHYFPPRRLASADPTEINGNSDRLCNSSRGTSFLDSEAPSEIHFESTITIARLAGKQACVVLNQSPVRGSLVQEATEAVKDLGVALAPTEIMSRVAFIHAFTTGLGVQASYFPKRNP
jgi:hypothetical protein